MQKFYAYLNENIYYCSQWKKNFGFVEIYGKFEVFVYFLAWATVLDELFLRLTKYWNEKIQLY